MSKQTDVSPEATPARLHKDFIVSRLAAIAESDAVTPSLCLAALELMVQRLNTMAERE